MWSWLALLLTPLLTLGNQGLSHSLVTPACAHQTEMWLHLIHLATLALCLLLLLMAWRENAALAGLRDDGGAATSRRRFVGRMAVPTAALFALVTASQWLSVWLLSPCAV